MNNDEPAPVDADKTMHWPRREADRAKAIEFARQGGVILCPVCLAELTIYWTKTDGTINQLPVTILCSKDKSHFYIHFHYRFPDDPLEKFMREASKRRKDTGEAVKPDEETEKSGSS